MQKILKQFNLLVKYVFLVGTRMGPMCQVLIDDLRHPQEKQNLIDKCQYVGRNWKVVKA